MASNRPISSGLRLIGLVFLAYSVVSLACATVGSLRVPPDANGVRLLGHAGLALALVATYAVFAGLGLVYSRAVWASERRRLERARLVTPEQWAAARHGRWSWRGSIALFGGVMLLASVAWSAYFQILSVNSMGWWLAAFGALWLDLSRRIARFQHARDTVFYWMPEPIWSWRGRDVVQLTLAQDE